MPKQRESLSADWPAIDPGSFRHQITFLDKVIVQTAAGPAAIWQAGSPPDVAWAKVETVRGIDVIKSGQDVTQVYLTVTMWYDSQVQATDHILSPSGKEYVIQAVENVREMNMYLVLTCIALAGNN